ncbi:hypothetical protein [Prosthecomicrobium sp. N25]|uniref:hypothetical protein n=1 Tax=Prosthecomicrobium sp. N25 TaxID=3129254 RepID=UPI0030785C8A
MTAERDLIRTAYDLGLADLRSDALYRPGWFRPDERAPLGGPERGLNFLMPYAVAVVRSDGIPSQSHPWPDFESLSREEMKAIEIIHMCLIETRSVILFEYLDRRRAYYAHAYDLLRYASRFGGETYPRALLERPGTAAGRPDAPVPTASAVALVALVCEMGLDAEGNLVGTGEEAY